MARAAAGIGHDIRNLLQVIQANASLLAEEPGADRELVDGIRDGGAIEVECALGAGTSVQVNLPVID